MNLIVEKSKHVKWYTYLDEVFLRVSDFQNYYWLISGLELNCCPDTRLEHDPVVIRGDALCEILQNHKIQFIWGVLSGFKEEIKSLPKELPFADGNRNFWVGCPKPQALGAEIEIVCWDSTCTLFIGTDASVEKKLRQIYPDMQDLDIANKTRKEQST